MYRRILVPLENSPYDAAILAHVRELARLCGSSLVFIHVADGVVARNLKQLDLRESEEMHADRDYLERVAEEFEREGFDADAVLASGDPGAEICAAAQREQVDLIAMATHGHKFLADIMRGSVANDVRHATAVPVLLVRGQGAARSGDDAGRGEARRGA
jgi:nucleotide-binding universal stress UspA family protein